MVSYDTKLTALYGVGEKVAEKLSRLGLVTVDDLLRHYPRRYEDYSRPVTIADCKPGENHIIKGSVLSVRNNITARQRLKITEAVIQDRTGVMNMTWFNQPYLSTVLKPGTEWLFGGKVIIDRKRSLSMSSPAVEREPKVIPVYPETAGLTSRQLHKFIYEIKGLIDDIEDWLPASVKERYGLIPLSRAYQLIHFPESVDYLGEAKKRLAFDELFLLLAQIKQNQSELGLVKSPALPTPVALIKKFVLDLPFKITDSQRQASWQIVSDMTKESPMNRLLEGDVGSGKTVVGAIAALSSIENGYQVAWLAPTEILANQHYETCSRILKTVGVSVGLLTGSTSAKDRLVAMKAQLVIGTQALIQESVTFEKLGLLIVDEQHRFGVKQRAHLIKNGDGLIPHCLTMTATPIPRTLALALYGDLSISRLLTRPTNRLPITSQLIFPSERLKAYTMIREQIKLGRQAFIICPLVENSVTMEQKAATTEYERLSRSVFPDLRLGLLHGQLKSKEKAEVMAKFSAGDLDILVSTAVIEVGIDVPNASVMVIEGADRFGLAQLHQFRGRVGRAGHQSYCLVMSDSQIPAVVERLKAFVNTDSGFEIAELDLQIRGPGQLAGLIQSGLSDLKIASLSDIELIQTVKSAVDLAFDGKFGSIEGLIDELKRRYPAAYLA